MKGKKKELKNIILKKYKNNKLIVFKNKYLVKIKNKLSFGLIIQIIIMLLPLFLSNND